MSAIKVPAIEFRDVSKSFDEVQALHNVSFILQPAQMISITGAAASGKSVLLHLAIGLIAPDSGKILINGQEIQDLEEEELLAIRRNAMGIAFQEDTLFSSLSVFDNAAYRLDDQGWSEADTEVAVKEILQFVGLENDAQKLPEELSIGMRRRLEIARALTGWPPILLFDEPVTGLDPITARRILDLIIRARDQHNISCLYVTKELHEITYLATYIAALDSSGEVNIEKGIKTDSPELKVLLLDKGEMVFFGNINDYQSSELPAAQQMIRYELPKKESLQEINDPWGHNLDVQLLSAEKMQF